MRRRDFLSAIPGLALEGSAAPPNIVLILCDDLGYGDVGVYGSPIRTPNLDRMAAGGMRFTHFTSANPVCSPSRAAWMTGRYPTRAGVPSVLTPRDEGGLPEFEQTVAQALKKRNYKTICVGKWHLGHRPAYLPTTRGFDEYLGIPYSNGMQPPVLLHNTEVVEPVATQETLTQRYTAKAVKFIEESAGSPFFLYLPHAMPHLPLAASRNFLGRSPQGLYGDVVEEIDWSVGEILNALKRLRLDRNTLVLFSSDNGPWFQGSPGRLRGRKGMTWEGGVRVPFIAWWPGTVPAGGVCDALTSPLDFLPTVAKLSGAKPANPLDGIDIWPLLSGEKRELERDLLLYFDDLHAQCARMGRWKIHVSRYNTVAYSPDPPAGRHNLPLRAPELYDLVADCDESFDVASRHPDVVKQMMARMEVLMRGFPAHVQAAWNETRRRPNQETRAGSVSRAPLQESGGKK